jgi:Niemann-Pick C1 protein
MHACLSNPDFVLIGGFDSKIIEDVSQNRNEVRLSAVQGYMSNFYRKYGSYVARNPIMVLASSLVIVILLCVGLIRLKVETRPEKV